MPPTPRLAAFLLQREDEQRASGRKVGHLRPERRVETEDERPEEDQGQAVEATQDPDHDRLEEHRQDDQVGDPEEDDDEDDEEEEEL